MNLQSYINRKDLTRILDCDRTTVTRILNDMEASGRYPPEDFIRDRKLVLINPEAFADYIEFRKRRKKGQLMPPYKRREA